MYRTIDRIKLFFLVLFALISAGMVIYHVGWLAPARRCEVDQRGWWDSGGRVCAKPVLISDITGRTIEDKAAEAAAKKAIGRTERPAPAKPKS